MCWSEPTSYMEETSLLPEQMALPLYFSVSLITDGTNYCPAPVPGLLVAVSPVGLAYLCTLYALVRVLHCGRELISSLPSGISLPVYNSRTCTTVKELQLWLLTTGLCPQGMPGLTVTGYSRRGREKMAVDIFLYDFFFLLTGDFVHL